MKIFINKVLGPPPPVQSLVILHLGICLRAEKYREGNKKKKKRNGENTINGCILFIFLNSLDFLIYGTSYFISIA